MDLRFVDIRNISQLCKSKDGKENVPLRVEIPYYQRPYKWDDSRIGGLIKDFYDNEEGENTEEKYFAGSIVMVEGDNGRFKIIDGQQRITTLFLMNYLRFILFRAHIEDLIHKSKTSQIILKMEELISIAENIFDERKIESLKNIKTEICNYMNKIENRMEAKQFDEAEKQWSELLSFYRTKLCLPINDLTDTDRYNKASAYQNSLFLSNVELALTYSRKSYNEKLREAMSRMIITIDKNGVPHLASVSFEKNYGEKNSITEKYISAMSNIYNNIKKIYFFNNDSNLDYVEKINDVLKRLWNNIDFCVVVTGREKDAYTLFEVLNDRNFPVEDLELIKNLFFKKYCEYEGDTSKADKFIEEADIKWGYIFNETDNKNQSKLISYLAAQYFTSDSSLKYNDNEKYRKAIDEQYLREKKQYDGYSLLNDICIYEMLSIILEEFDIRYKKKAENVIKAEREQSKSITYRAMNLLNALKLYGVMPAITNIIIKKFLDDNSFIEGDNSTLIKEFEMYVRAIRDDGDNKNIKCVEIHNVSYEFWRFALLAQNSDKPRNIAKDYIARNYVSHAEYVLRVERQDMDDLNEEFRRWINAWRYGNEASQLKVKVLFLNLFFTNKVGNTLFFNKTGTQFKTDDIQLDHLEPDKINMSAPERYFKPKSNTAREDYTDSLGNFLIMDKLSNVEKNTIPLQEALGKYDVLSTHWVIKELHEIFIEEGCGIDKQIDNSTFRVPNENFFSRRKQRLITYFKAILNKRLGDDSVEIPNI